jgi:hypothetical protein
MSTPAVERKQPLVGGRQPALVGGRAGGTSGNGDVGTVPPASNRAVTFDLAAAEAV